jgi:RNA polymerase sigma-70 factor (ECF subfamily)
MDSDEVLFDRLRAGDMRAFDLLYERVERPLFGFIRARLGNPQEAEDVLQETFLAVLRERTRPTELRSVRAWLVSVAHRLCLNRLRSRKRQGRALEEVAHGPPNETAACADAALVTHERSRILAGAVERLPTGLAEMYHLRASGMSYEELADVLKLPMGTVKSRMHDLVERLREEMSQ